MPLSRVELIQTLKSLLEQLSTSTPTLEASASEANRLPLEQWQDESHLYIEVELPGRNRSDLDLCVSGDRVFIRLEL